MERTKLKQPLSRLKLLRNKRTDSHQAQGQDLAPGHPPAPRLPLCHHAPSMVNGLTLQNCKKAPIKCSLLQELGWSWCFFIVIEWSAKINSVTGRRYSFFKKISRNKNFNRKMKEKENENKRRKWDNQTRKWTGVQKERTEIFWMEKLLKMFQN